MKTNKTHSTNYRTAFIAVASLAWLAFVSAWVYLVTGGGQ